MLAQEKLGEFLYLIGVFFVSRVFCRAYGPDLWHSVFMPGYRCGWGEMVKYLWKCYKLCTNIHRYLAMQFNEIIIVPML